MSTPQSGPSTSKSKSQSKIRITSTPSPTTTSTPSTWRCADHKRLHRDNEACTNAPPSSPIVDTPSKRMRSERKLAGSGGQSQSQQTEPTPSRPQRSSQSRPQTGLVLDAVSEEGSSSESEGSVGSFKLPGSPNSVHPSNYVHPSAPPGSNFTTPALGALSLPDPAVPASWAEDDFNIPRPAAEQNSTSDRIPETPANPSIAPPHLPRLTESNLLALNSNSISSPNPANIPSSNAAITSPSPPSLPSSTTPSTRARINRLLLRTHLTTLNHRAELSLAHQNLLAAQDLARREISRRKFWEAVCLALVMVWVLYGVWGWWNGAEFEYVRARGRERFGLV